MSQLHHINIPIGWWNNFVSLVLLDLFVLDSHSKVTIHRSIVKLCRAFTTCKTINWTGQRGSERIAKTEILLPIVKCWNCSLENGFSLKPAEAVQNHQIYMNFDEVLHSQHHNAMFNNVHLCFSIREPMVWCLHNTQYTHTYSILYPFLYLSAFGLCVREFSDWVNV